MIAPEYDSRASSHSLSLNDPLRLREIGERHFAVKGTPTDCIIMGARHILKDRPPDLVLSGVNRGRNAGEDVIYSGTVAGAVEGTILGIPSLALSQAYLSRSNQPPHWDTAMRFAPDIIRRVLANGYPAGRADQRQFPQLPPGDVKGISVSRQGRRQHRNACRSTRVRTAAATPITGSPMCARGAMPPNDGTDVSALADNRIAMTPLRLDMTDDSFMVDLAKLLGPNGSGEGAHL